MMLAVVLPGSFIITWFIPSSIVEKLKVKVPTSVLKKYSVTKLKIAGERVYPEVVNEVRTGVIVGECWSLSSPVYQVEMHWLLCLDLFARLSGLSCLVV